MTEEEKKFFEKCTYHENGFCGWIKLDITEEDCGACLSGQYQRHGITTAGIPNKADLPLKRKYPSHNSCKYCKKDKTKDCLDHKIVNSLIEDRENIKIRMLNLKLCYNPKFDMREIGVRVKFGFNIYSQTFKCSFCRKDFDNDPNINKSLFLRLEIFKQVMDFPICPKCKHEGLFETQRIEIKDNISHPIYLA